jgi:hypothetical protein
MRSAPGQLATLVPVLEPFDLLQNEGLMKQFRSRIRSLSSGKLTSWAVSIQVDTYNLVLSRFFLSLL